MEFELHYLNGLQYNNTFAKNGDEVGWLSTVQTPPRPPFHQCIIKAVGFFAAGKPVKPPKTTMKFSGRPRKSGRLNDA
jgi:hypothetical protein